MDSERFTVITPEGLDEILQGLRARGYRVLGPTVENGAVVYADLAGADELPVGRRDVQEAGSYRLERREDDARFGFAVGPHSWKRFLFPPRAPLWTARADVEPAESEIDEAPLAFFGLRSCELHAIEIQDRVFLRGRFTDRDYAARREGAFIVAVNCFEPGGTCFCASTGTGPAVESGYDLALTELLEGEHRFLVEAGSERGEELVRELSRRPATDTDLAAARASVDAARMRMGRRLDTAGLHDVLLASLEHPRWDDVASRCLGCANCTLVCPTCFCSAVEDTTDLSGEEAGRVRVWDTCFSLDHSYIHGGSIRPSARSRYRQWLTHKFATWVDQFGTAGCVGCGRCITWCPAGIDVTEELAALREEEPANV